MSFWYYVAVVISMIIIIIYSTGCQKKEEEIEPTPEPQKYEVPPEILAQMTSPEAIVQWVQNHWQDGPPDNSWADCGKEKHQDYPLTPAEFFMRKIRCFRHGTIIEKPPYVGDCNSINPLNAYFLKKLGWDAWVAVIPTDRQGVKHMFCYAYKGDECIVINNIWLYKQYKSPDEWQKMRYPDHPIKERYKIDDWLKMLYDKGHHKYYEVIE